MQHVQRFDARVIGAGRAGGSLASALSAVGWHVDGPLDRTAALAGAASDADIVILAVPDRAVEAVARGIEPGDAVLVHVAGALGLDVLAPHPRTASVHPLVSLPSPEVGARNLRGAWFATAGEETATARIVAALDGRGVEVADADRIRYHATAVVAANHLVALLGQVERLARSIDVPLDAYLDLARGALDNAASLGPAAALTGPVARGDWDTVASHLDALPDGERALYSLLADAAHRLVDAP